MKGRELMTGKIHAAAVQFTISVGDIDANITKMTEAVTKAAADGARLIVLPEMWSTGYSYRNLPELAARTGEVVDLIKEISRKKGLVIAGSLPEPHGAKVYNTAYLVDNGEVKATYRKMHLFSLMKEDTLLDAGEDWVVAETSAGKIGMFICYDLRFPELARRLAVEGAEIIIVPAEWPKPREEHWRTLLRARAIENQLFVIAANCCGIQGKLDFFGESMIIGPKGEILAAAGYEPAVIQAELDFSVMTEWRGQITCFADRRPAYY